MKKKIIALTVIAAMMTGSVVSAQAAVIDNADTSAGGLDTILAAEYAEVGSVLEPTAEIPSYYSSRDEGYVTEVQSQLYNTCWAYSSSATMEVHMNMTGIGNGLMSPMHGNYWGTAKRDGTGWQRNYTDAGYPYISLGYLTSFSGSVTEKEFPSSLQMSDYEEFGSDIRAYAGATSVVYLNAYDRDTVKTAVMTYGAAVGNLNYSSSFLNAETAAYYCDAEGLQTYQLNGHAVSIVGWDDNYSKEKFAEGHQPENDGAWLCKNSWGNAWCGDGYCWMSYEDKYLFDPRFGPSYSIVATEQYTNDKKLQQNEIYGNTYEFDYMDHFTPAFREMTYVNVLDFTGGYNHIDEVIFESTSENSEYEIYYIPLDKAEVPLSDQSEWTLLAQGTVAYQGYHAVSVDDFEVTTDKAGIGIKMKMGEYGDSLGIGCDEWLATSDSNYIFYPGSKAGQSYIIGYQDDVQDVMDFYATMLDDDIGSTFVIKAMTHFEYGIGDVNRDGEMTIIDVTTIQRHLAHLEDFDDEQMALGDYDSDGMLTILDCTRMQRKLAGMI